MLNELKKIFLAGIGAMATTYDKANEIIGEMVQKGRLTVDEGKELSEELKRDFKTQKNSTTNKIMSTIEEIKPVTKDDVRTMIEDYEFAYRAELDALKKQVEELEKTVKKHENKE